MALTALKINGDSQGAVTYGMEKPGEGNNDTVSNTTEVVQAIPTFSGVKPKAAMIGVSGADVLFTDDTNASNNSITTGSFVSSANVFISGTRLVFLDSESTHIHYKGLTSPYTINFEWYS